jgi:hypothetical protein
LPSDRPESSCASGPTRVRALASIYGFVTFALLFCSAVRATENITPESHARRYFKADLVIFGEVLGCTTRVVEKKNVPGDSGWVNHHTTFMNECGVRVDSVLKGLFRDSTLVVQRKSSQQSRSRFDRITEGGDSLYLGEMTELGYAFDVKIPPSGSWILFLTKKDSTYDFMWHADHNKTNLDLYKKFEEEGEDILEKYDLSAWWMIKKDSLWELQLKPKPVFK